jgi:hypothetical protein
VTDKVGRAGQLVQHVDGSPPGLDFIDTFANIHGHTWHYACLRASPLPFDRPVHMSAEQPGHLWVPADNVLQCRSLFRTTVAPDLMITDIERRMVDKQQCRPVGLLGQYTVEPVLSRCAETPLALADER